MMPFCTAVIRLEAIGILEHPAKGDAANADHLQRPGSCTTLALD